MIEKLDGQGQSLMVCEPGYGRLNRIRRFADGEVYQFEHNERGRITKAQTRRERMAFDYDKDGRATKDERNGLGVAHKFAGDRLVSTTIFRTFTIRYERWCDWRLIITDPTGRKHAIDLGENGLILKKLANGTMEAVQYDDGGRCLRKVVKSTTGERRARSYYYSAAGDLVRVEDSRRGWIEYHYDAAHRLRRVEREDGRNELYYHDTAGNLMLQPGLDGVKISAGNKLKEANSERFHYNHRDNVVLRESEKGTTGYNYDSFDQLVGISLNGREWGAAYDALGRRVRKLWPGQTTEYYWDGDRLAAEVRSDGSVRIYVYVDERALVPFLYVDYESIDATPESGKVKYLFTNHLGAPERVEDETGRTIWQGEVSAYGMVALEVGRRDEINLRFPGHYCDPETGLHYNRFRYYDPRLGRYLQHDPLGLAGGYNLYAYLANPLTGVDILGLSGKQGGKQGGCGGNGKPQNRQHEGSGRPAREGPPKGSEIERPPKPPKSWDKFDPNLNDKFRTMLSRFRRNKDLEPDFSGGEGRIFRTERSPSLALKRWYKSRIEDKARSTRLLRDAKAAIDSNPRLKSVMDVVDIHGEGDDWIMRDFDPKSVPLKNAIADEVGAMVARDRAISALQGTKDPVLSKISEKITRQPPSENIHWSPDKGKILIIDMQ